MYQYRGTGPIRFDVLDHRRQVLTDKVFDLRLHGRRVEAREVGEGPQPLRRRVAEP